MHENEIFMHENDILMHENEDFAPGMIFPPEMFMGSWAVHSFMHEISTHENLWAKFSFSCMKIPFSPIENSFSCMEMKFEYMKLFIEDFCC